MDEKQMARMLLKRNPLLLLRIASARANVALRRTPTNLKRKRIRGVVFEFDFEDKNLLDSFQYGQPAMKAMLFGSYEPLLTHAMSRFLEPGGTFIDVGANVGYISAVGASMVGTSGCVHSFEPVPKYFARLKRLAELNPEYCFFPNQCAAGEEPEGTATLRLHPYNIGGNTLVPNHLLNNPESEEINVPLRRLDDYLCLLYTSPSPRDS